MKEHLRVEAHEDDDLITDLIKSAREYIEDFTGRQLMRATWQMKLSSFPSGRILEFPRPPLASVTSIAYLDVDGNSQTFSSANYTVYTNATPGYLELTQTASWESTYGNSQDVTVTYLAGASTATSVPYQLRQALKLLVAHWYEHREAVIDGNAPTPLAIGMDRLLWPHRCVGA